MKAAANITRSDADLACDECGRYGAIEVGERKLCPDCYATSGSCCPEFGREKQDAEIDLCKKESALSA